MGVAILSGVIASLDSSSKGPTAHLRAEKWESHTPGTLTPAIPLEDESQPSKFIACIGRDNTVAKLRETFLSLGPLGASVDCRLGENLWAVQQADVVLLW